ncbi:MAG: hypothetical protein ACXV5D_04365 [Halobacteriota archaeon]
MAGLACVALLLLRRRR